MSGMFSLDYIGWFYLIIVCGLIIIGMGSDRVKNVSAVCEGEVNGVNKELITAQALAEILDLSVETIWRYTRENRIPCVVLGSRQYRYKLDDVIKALSSDIVRENTVPYETEPAKKLTYQDYLDIPEEPGYRFEILEGILIKEPSPSVIHQRASRKLQRILEDYFEEVDHEGEIFNAPLDVTPLEFNVVQPDLFYVSGEQKLIVKDTRIDGAPKLVVEVISPSSRRKDRLQKMRVYQKAQVHHYWLLDPQEETLECFAWLDGVYALVASGMDEDIVEHPNFTGLSIALKSLWSK
jgi:Uma2 family endonuclease/predicted DNA-binding transcriptional regulator AlpA